MNRQVIIPHALLKPGFRKGSYTVLDTVRVKTRTQSALHYLCRCDCGTERFLTKVHLESVEGCVKCRWKRKKALGKKKVSA